MQNQLLFGEHWELNLGVRQDKVTYDVKNKNRNSVDTKAEWTSGRERVYTWETLTSRDFQDLDGMDLNRVPDYKYVVGFDFYPIKNMKCNIDINGTGPYWIDYMNRIEYDAKTTVDMGIRYEFKKWSIWALGKNIFDEDVESVYNSNGQLNSKADEIARNGKYDNLYYPKNGQYFEVGLTYNF